MANPINPSDFVSVIDNPLFTLQPGTTFTTSSPDGSAIDTFTVTNRTKVIDGVTVVVVKDTAFEDGEVVERTLDYFAQDKKGNVWYFGEDTKTIENGHVVSTEGTWRAGVDGALPGIIMEAHPQVGDKYIQENAPGVAEDRAEVAGMNETVNVPYGSFAHGLETFEFSLLEPPGTGENKFYIEGVGFVRAEDVVTGEIEELVKVSVDGTGRADKLFGYAGGDELSGNGGNDQLDGWLGSDTVHGGSGNDLIEGGGKLRFDGGDDHAADYLYGDSGKDTILVGAGDHAFGGSDNDLIQLLDNGGFGSIDGGSQNFHDVGISAGDVLQFHGNLDLTTPGLGGHVAGIETLSMHDGKGGDSCTLNAQDVLDLGSGTFNPAVGPHDTLGKGDAMRIDGDHGDKLTLSGDWTAIDPHNGPDGFDVYASAAPGGQGNVYALVQEDVAVTITAATT